MNAFTALADPTRRKILELLAQSGQLSATEIMEQFQVSAPAISQHLKVLREADLVRVEKRGQQRIYQLNPQAMQEVETWARQMTQLWNQRFDALERVLEVEKMKSMQSKTEKTEDMTPSAHRELTLTRVFNAPRELVFQAWTDPKLMAQWWGPKIFTTPRCELDLRPGGAIRIDMQWPNGNIDPMGGTFQEILPPERLVFTSTALFDEHGVPQIENLQTITFTALPNGQTQVTVHIEVLKESSANAAALAGMEQGWSESLDKLADFLVKA
jgi:uncharacterized protein YndB with AHSA1/START domain/DNA-binding transcriptional ArsR family regulator